MSSCLNASEYAKAGPIGSDLAECWCRMERSSWLGHQSRVVLAALGRAVAPLCMTGHLPPFAPFVPSMSNVLVQ